jgi:hypothetical protein
MNSNERSELGNVLASGELTTLVDLQAFLMEELGAGDGKANDIARAFTPLTDGLGIHSTGKPMGASRAGASSFVAPSVSNVTEFHTIQPLDSERKATRPSAQLFIDEGLEALPSESESSSDIGIVPPPVPLPTLFGRFLSGFVDQCFVLMVFLLALAITSNALSGNGADFGARFLRQLGSPAFLRSAAMEFGMIWLAYLTLSIAILETTFGMWVWGLRFNFGTSGRFWKKLARITLGMFVYPFIAPTLLLLFQKRGYNLVDGITQSSVYKS